MPLSTIIGLVAAAVALVATLAGVVWTATGGLAGVRRDFRADNNRVRDELGEILDAKIAGVRDHTASAVAEHAAACPGRGLAPEPGTWSPSGRVRLP